LIAEKQPKANTKRILAESKKLVADKGYHCNVLTRRGKPWREIL
jgi:nucleotide-binding universal stress UspA family protein